MKRLALILACALPLFAEIRPSFILDRAAWDATDIVVATKGTVVEVWKGTMHPGDRITEAGFDTAASRVVLFLGTNDEPEVSSAWIEDGQVFAYQQVFNPGPATREHLGAAGIFEHDVRAVVELQRKFKAAATPEELRTLVHDRSIIVQLSMVNTLGEGGPLASRALMAILEDPLLERLHDSAVAALARAGGDAVVADLVRVLDRELAYFTDHRTTIDALRRGEPLTSDTEDHMALHHATVYRAFAA